MTAEPNRYRGIEINVEMQDGAFICSIHDPMHHEKHQFATLVHTLSENAELAVREAQRQIDRQIDEEMERVDVRAGKNRSF